MQWLTAILAFATTMLLFAVVVSTLVETIHRAIGSRTIGLNTMIGHFYDQVIKRHLPDENKLSKNEFIEQMTLVRAPQSSVKNKKENSKTPDVGDNVDSEYPNRWSFKRLTHLPTATFMERLGSSSFSNIVDDIVDETKKQQLLKDIAQKFESFGQESGLHFESRARLTSVLVAMVVAWIFYVHPYQLIHTYLKNPEIATQVADLASDSKYDYETIIKNAEEVRQKFEANNLDAADSKVTKEDLDILYKGLVEDIKSARTEVEKISNAGAPIGWPEENIHCYTWSEGRFTNCSSLPKSEAGPGLTIYYPDKWVDVFWLILGGLLIGLGAPFWAKSIRQLTQARNVSDNLKEILKPELQSQNNTQASLDTPVTTEAFSVAVDAKKLTKAE